MILKYNEYNNKNEGLKTNILVGLLSLFGSSAMGQQKVQPLRTHTNKESTAKSYIKQGWTLDRVQIDTLFNQVKQSNPDTIIRVIRLKLDKNQYFDSGRFELSQSVKDTLNESLTNIDGVLTNIVITSSTDKQGLLPNLKGQLQGLGYSPDNQGLSKARSNSLREFLVDNIGVNDSLISTKEYFEQGGKIDQSARYVSVDIFYMKVTEEVMPSINKEPTINNTYYLSKDRLVGKTIGNSGVTRSIKTHLVSDKTHANIRNVRNVKDLQCFPF